MSSDGFRQSINTPAGYNQQPEGRAPILDQTYLGFVRKSEDEIRMGRLKVWIPALGGDSDVEDTWYTVNYCSPFAGATPIAKYKGQDPARHPDGNVKGGKTMQESQIGYGFWMVPPDLDNEVIVQFINGDPNAGIWIGCLYKQYMNHMVPGIPRNNSHQEGEDGELPPVVEYNKWDDIGNNDDPIRPRFDPLHFGLKMQGLYKDPQRGPASGGARRESPSKVYGFLTPEGSQIYADDYECNQLIRLRTKSGVQIMLHDNDGYIYMISKRGNSWLQISDDGIDFYSSKGVNIHSTNGYNFHTDKDYNLHIGGSFNVFTEGDFRVSTVGNVNMLAGKDMRQDVGGAFHSTIEKNRNIKIKGADNLKIDGNQTSYAAKTVTISSGQMIVMKTPMVTQNNDGDPNGPDEPATAEGKDPTDMKDRKLQEKYPEDERKSVTERMPTHEPFEEHPTEPPKDPDDPQAGQQKEGDKEDAANGNSKDSDTSASADKTERGGGDEGGGDPKKKPLRDLIGKTEGTDKGDGYNETLAYGKFTGGDVDLTKMSVNEVRQLQRQMLAHPDNNWNSSAVGRYQIVGKTLDGLKSSMGLSGNELFTPSLQDKMADKLIDGRGYNKWQSGSMSTGSFMNGLSSEWASLPNSSGKGTYAGQGIGASGGTLKNTLDNMRANPISAEYEAYVESLETGTESTVSFLNVGKVVSSEGVGSAVLIDYSGSMITNAHVVGVNKPIGTIVDVEIGNTVRKAKITRINAKTDIAQIVLTDFKDLIPVVTGGEMKAGDTIYSFGFAFGKTFTQIEAVYTGENNKTVKYADPGGSSDGIIVGGLSAMKTKVINGLKPGMSGGPILDKNGRLIGINAATVPGKDEARFIPL